MEVTGPQLPGGSKTFPPVSRGNWDSQLPWHVRIVTLWRSMNWPQWDIFLLCYHPPSFFFWEIREKSKMGPVGEKESKICSCLHFTHMPSLDIVVSIVTVEGLHTHTVVGGSLEKFH